MVSGSVISAFELYRFRTLRRRAGFQATVVWDSPEYYLITIVLEFASPASRRPTSYHHFCFSHFSHFMRSFYPNEYVLRGVYRLTRKKRERKIKEIQTINEPFEYMWNCPCTPCKAFMQKNQNAKHSNVLQMIITVD